jgi:hypothetical protein
MRHSQLSSKLSKVCSVMRSPVLMPAIFLRMPFSTRQPGPMVVPAGLP